MAKYKIQLFITRQMNGCGCDSTALAMLKIPKFSSTALCEFMKFAFAKFSCYKILEFVDVEYFLIDMLW